MTQVIFPRIASCLENKFLAKGNAKVDAILGCCSSGIVRCSARFYWKFDFYISPKALNLVQWFQIPNDKLLGCLECCHSNSLRRKDIFVEIELAGWADSSRTSKDDCRIQIVKSDRRHSEALAEANWDLMNFLCIKNTLYRSTNSYFLPLEALQVFERRLEALAWLDCWL